MKTILISLSLLMMCVCSTAQQSPPSATAILKEACATAAKEKKNVFIIFHASWCGWCHKMDKSMGDPSCKQFFEDNYVIRHLVVDESKDKKNLENPGADELREKYHGKGLGIPFWLVFDPNENMLSDSRMRKPKDGPAEGDNIGCPANKDEVEYFIGILKKTSSLTDAELEIIKKRFRLNDQ